MLANRLLCGIALADVITDPSHDAQSSGSRIVNAGGCSMNKLCLMQIPDDSMHKPMLLNSR